MLEINYCDNKSFSVIKFPHLVTRKFTSCQVISFNVDFKICWDVRKVPSLDRGDSMDEL